MNNAENDFDEQAKRAAEKYGQMKKKPLIAKDNKHFDSADYAKNKQLEQQRQPAE